MGRFVTFSSIHLTALAAIAFVAIAVVQIAKEHVRCRRQIEVVLVMLLLGAPAVGMIWHAMNGTFHPGSSLPLELCHITAFTAAVLLVRPSRALYDVVFFWTTAGTFQGLLTPYLSEFGFPHFWFFQFFLWHGSIVWACCYMTFVRGYRPRGIGIFTTFVLTNTLCLAVFLINLATGGNYFFLLRPPATRSIIDHLGPWPYYILSLQVVGTGSFVLYYQLMRWVDHLPAGGFFRTRRMT